MAIERKIVDFVRRRAKQESHMLQSSLESEDILMQELKATKLFAAADPHLSWGNVEGGGSVIRALYQQGMTPDQYGLNSIVYREAQTIDGLKDAPERFLRFKESYVDKQGVVHSLEDLPIHKEVWAPELMYHKGQYFLFLTFGESAGHRLHCFCAESLDDEFVYCGTPEGAVDQWAIDESVLVWTENGRERACAFYSVWTPGTPSDTSQSIAIQMLDPNSLCSAITPPSVIATPLPQWSWAASERAVFEGPQGNISKDGILFFTAACNASWTNLYNTVLIVRNPSAQDMTSPEAWIVDTQPLFPSGIGIGHGMFIRDANGELCFVAHCKLSKEHGWDDRFTVKVPINERKLEERIQSIIANAQQKKAVSVISIYGSAEQSRSSKRAKRLHFSFRG